jgi:hypothetical protein
MEIFYTNMIKQAKESGISLKVVMIPNGHHQMSESPDETLDALNAFLSGT